jgi:hypothetical protein
LVTIAMILSILFGHRIHKSAAVPGESLLQKGSSDIADHHRTGRNESETAVEASGDGTLVLTTDTSRFSLFAVAEIELSTDSTATNGTAPPTTNDELPHLMIVSRFLRSVDSSHSVVHGV